MAVLSHYFYFGIVAPDSFGAAQTADVILFDNPALEREIADWWATQATFPTRAHRTIIDAKAILGTLAKTLAADARIDMLRTPPLCPERHRFLQHTDKYPDSYSYRYKQFPSIQIPRPRAADKYSRPAVIPSDTRLPTDTPLADTATVTRTRRPAATTLHPLLPTVV